MKSAIALPTHALSGSRTRALDYLELTKPRIALMVLCTVAAGFFAAAPSSPDYVLLVHVLLATGVLAAGASAINQWMERNSDALMNRTANRPLPASRLRSAEVLAFGALLGIVGLIYSIVFVGKPLCVFLLAATFIGYVGVYTPLKRWTTLNTLVGAVPGALPVLIGWSAVSDVLTTEAWVLFLVLFLWQVPHFLAIAWIYRDDYARAGMQMLPVYDSTGRLTGRQMFLYAGCLLLVSLWPFFAGKAGIVNAIVIGLLGAGFQYTTFLFMRRPSVAAARLVLRASLLYLPLVLAALVMQQALPGLFS